MSGSERALAIAADRSPGERRIPSRCPLPLLFRHCQQATTWRAFVWLAAIGKALVKEGVISVESIVAELETIKTGGGQPPEMIRDIDGMIKNVRSS